MEEELVKLVKDLEELKAGVPIGYVSASEIVKVGREKDIVVELPYDNYVNRKIELGQYLGIYTYIHRVFILGRVVEISRSHAAGLVGRLPVFTQPDPTGVQTPAVVRLEPLTECPREWSGCEPDVVKSPIDPLSVVFEPSPDFIKTMLGIPRSGAVVGLLRAGSKDLNVQIRLPEAALYQHMLVVGTTGSGKTSFLKNLALSTLNELNATVIALDLQGDYLHLALPGREKGLYPPADKITVVMPITRHLLHDLRDDIWHVANEYLKEDGYTLADLYDEEFAKNVGCALGRIFVQRNYEPNAEVVDCKTEVESVETRSGERQTAAVPRHYIKAIDMTVAVGDWTFELRLIPWALRFKESYKDIPRIYPVFTEKVSMFFARIVEMLNFEDLDSLILGGGLEKPERKGGETRLQGLEKLEEIGKRMRLHNKQVENLIRGLHSLYEIGIFDVKYEVGERVERNIRGAKSAYFGEPDYRSLFNGLVVVDLGAFRENPRVASIVVYRILSKLFEVRDVEMRAGVHKPTFVFIDEAHNYFPQGGREDFAKESVEAMINKITRLGRVRKIGVIFATHMPDDLNDLIIQLTNTKVAFRSERRVLERVGLADYADQVLYAPSGVGVIQSWIFRTHTLVFHSLKPMTKHRGHD